MACGLANPKEIADWELNGKVKRDEMSQASHGKLEKYFGCEQAFKSSSCTTMVHKSASIQIIILPENLHSGPPIL